MAMLRYFFVFLILTTLFGCSTVTETPADKTAVTPASKGPTLYTAKGCFSSMLNLAQRWSPDAMPFHMESEVNADATGQEGRATVWRAFFASRSRGTMKTVSCSGSRLATSPALGFSDTPEIAYAANVPAAIFEPASFQTDSDKAFAVTLEHGGAPLVKKDPQSSHRRAGAVRAGERRRRARRVPLQHRHGAAPLLPPLRHPSLLCAAFGSRQD